MKEQARSAVAAVPKAASAVPKAAAAIPRAVSSLGRAVGSLYDKAIDKVLARPFEVTSAHEARAVLDDPDAIDVSALADQIQQVVLLATPVLRRVGKFKRMPGVKRIPLLFSVVTLANLTRAVRQGVREVQVVGSYVAARIQAATGAPPDPELVKRLTVQIYLSPSHRHDFVPSDRLPTGKLLQTWLISGLLGRTSNKKAVRAIGAVERLDLTPILALPSPSAN
jgi:hypothetical protein